MKRFLISYCDIYVKIYIFYIKWFVWEKYKWLLSMSVLMDG